MTEELIQLSWYRDNKLHSRIFERSTIFNTRNITKLADYGIPISSLTAAALTRFFSEFEKANLTSLPKAIATQTLGWQEDGESFHLGSTCYSTAQDTDEIIFQGADDGNDQLAHGFAVKGSLGTWVSLVKKLEPHPKVLSAVYFSAATPFLQILQAPNFTVDWSHKTSAGKTTTLRLAASVWGNPDERDPDSIVKLWSSTKTSIGRIASMLNGLPLILDDTKLAGTGGNADSAKSLISATLYMIANGRDKARGSIKGIQTQGSWRTIMLSSGEQSAVSFTEDGGTRARTVTLWGPPFEEASGTVALVNEVNRTVSAHYGHAGVRIIEYIMENKQNWDLWRRSFEEQQTLLQTKTEENSVAGRVAGYFAVMKTIIPLVHDAIPELGNGPAIDVLINTIWETAITEVQHSDPYLTALKMTYDWAVQNQDKFYHKFSKDDQKEPFGGWHGTWNDKDAPQIKISISRNHLRALLEKNNYDPESTIRLWNESGYLDRGDNGIIYRDRLSSGHISVYRLSQKAHQAVFEGTNDPIDEECEGNQPMKALNGFGKRFGSNVKL